MVLSDAPAKMICTLEDETKCLRCVRTAIKVFCRYSKWSKRHSRRFTLQILGSVLLPVVATVIFVLFSYTYVSDYFTGKITTIYEQESFSWICHQSSTNQNRSYIPTWQYISRYRETKLRMQRFGLNLLCVSPTAECISQQRKCFTGQMFDYWAKKKYQSCLNMFLCLGNTDLDWPSPWHSPSVWNACQPCFNKTGPNNVGERGHWFCWSMLQDSDPKINSAYQARSQSPRNIQTR